MTRWLAAFDRRATRWMARHGIALLRISLAITFLWFGALKFFPGSSPAEDLAARTVSFLTGGAVPAGVSLPVLAAWECLIGLGLITGVFLRVTLLLLFVQVLGDKGKHARSAVGMGSLPMQIPVEIEVIVEVENRGQSPISRRPKKKKRK